MRKLILVSLILALIVVACGGGDGNKDNEATKVLLLG
jgi:hypothetical protein